MPVIWPMWRACRGMKLRSTLSGYVVFSAMLGTHKGKTSHLTRSRNISGRKILNRMCCRRYGRSVCTSSLHCGRDHRARTGAYNPVCPAPPHKPHLRSWYAVDDFRVLVDQHVEVAYEADWVAVPRMGISALEHSVTRAIRGAGAGYVMGQGVECVQC